MDCNAARLLLEFAGRGERELEASEAEVLRQHLADCPDCATVAHAERRADEHIGRAMRAVPVPAGLRERLLQKLTPGTKPWYRRWTMRGAAAAAVLLASLGTYLYVLNQPPAIDVKEVYEFVNARTVFSAKDVEDGFKELGVETVAPPRFKYELLDSYDMALLKGHRVPHLLFVTTVNGRSLVAHVYILSDRQFDLEETRRTGTGFFSGRRRVEILPNPNDSSYLYLVTYTSESLEQFIRPPPQQA